ncbi:hypothetical protein [Streptomyces niveus]
MATVTGLTGTRSTAPHGQPSSGCGQWSRRPHLEQSTLTHSSSQDRRPATVAGAPVTRGAETADPQGQG